MHRNPVKRGLAAEPDQVRLNGWEVLEMEVGDTG